MKITIKRKTIPITLTILRIFLAFIVMFLILASRKNIALILFGLTAFLSFFDGFVAKKLKYRSQLRSIIDLLGDKLLVNLSAVALVYTGILPLWAMLIFLLRDTLTISGGAILLYKDRKYEFKPSLLGKITLFSQIIALIPAISGKVDFVLLWAAIILTLISAVQWIFRSEYKKTKITDINAFQFTNIIKFADFFTLLNVVAGLASILFAIKGNFNMAITFLLGAAVFDYIDGIIARKFKQENMFGKELDSLADTISFGIAPAIFGFVLIQTTLAIIAFTVFLFCGILRLARYNIMDLRNKYEGMPITLNGVIIPIIYLIRIPADYYPYIYLILGILMVSTIRIKKFF